MGTDEAVSTASTKAPMIVNNLSKLVSGVNKSYYCMRK